MPMGHWSIAICHIENGFDMAFGKWLMAHWHMPFVPLWLLGFHSLGNFVQGFFVRNLRSDGGDILVLDRLVDFISIN